MPLNLQSNLINICWMRNAWKIITMPHWQVTCRNMIWIFLRILSLSLILRLSLYLSLPPLPHPISFLFYPVTLYLFLTFLPMCNSSIVVFFFLRYIESNIRCHSQFNLVSVLCCKIQFLASTENRTRDGWVCSRTLPLSYAIPHIEAN